MEKIEKEPLWTAKTKKLLTNPLGMENPITVQVLGICLALAVTVKMKPAIVMAISVTVVVALLKPHHLTDAQINTRTDQDHSPTGGDCNPGDYR